MSGNIVRRAAAGVACSACLWLSGCFVHSDTSSDHKLPTVGEELCDLKEARDDGALTEPEYDEARQRLLSRLDKPPGR